MVRRAAVLCAALVAVAAPAWAATAVVPVGDDWFGHDEGHDGATAVHELSVRRGALVRWIWVGAARHNVAAVPGPRRRHSPTQSGGTFLW